MTTHSKSDNASRCFFCDNKFTSVSGVVIKISGGLSAILFLFACEVSPCLISIFKSSFSA